MTPALCLGTAQFGLAYGITNVHGQVPDEEVANLLDYAQNVGIRLIDTAQAYGNAELVLGDRLPKSHDFRLISKLPAQSQQQFSAQHAGEWQQAFLTSCRLLGVNSLDALLLHSPADLSKPGAHHLENWLLSLREQGLVKRIGVSIYSAKDLDFVNPSLLDLVQLPLSLFDQRLLKDGTIAKLRERGTAIHARSLFLQGLLLTHAAHWPEWVDSKVISHQQALEALAEERGCCLLDLALAFAKEQSDLEAVVVGICSVGELLQLHSSWTSSFSWQGSDWRKWSLRDSRILDPRLWPH